MIPVILEDMSHDMMQEIVTFGEKINVMSNSVEECMAFILGRNLNIIHSMHFMNSSLQNLFKNLPKDKSTYSFVPNYRGEVKLQILNWIFSLNFPHISDKHYEHAMRVWNEFRMI